MGFLYLTVIIRLEEYLRRGHRVFLVVLPPSSSGRVTILKIPFLLFSSYLIHIPNGRRLPIGFETTTTTTTTMISTITTALPTVPCGVLRVSENHFIYGLKCTFSFLFSLFLFPCCHPFHA